MKKLNMEILKIEKLYGVTDLEKFESLKKEMKKNRFENIPPIVVLENDCGYFAVTGSHRYAAAVELGFDNIG